MRTFIAITRCLKFRAKHGEFAFRGSYLGHLIRKLVLTAPHGMEWEKGEEYVLYVVARRINGDTLEGDVIKLKKLSEFLFSD